MRQPDPGSTRRARLPLVLRAASPGLRIVRQNPGRGLTCVDIPGASPPATQEPFPTMPWPVWPAGLASLHTAVMLANHAADGSGAEPIDLDAAVADVDAFGIIDLHVVLARAGTCLIYQVHQGLRGGHEVGVIGRACRGQLLGERSLVGRRVGLMLGQDEPRRWRFRGTAAVPSHAASRRRPLRRP